MFLLKLLTLCATISVLKSKSSANCVVYSLGCEDVDKICCTNGWQLMCYCSDEISTTTTNSFLSFFDLDNRDVETTTPSDQKDGVVSSQSVGMDVFVLSGVVVSCLLLTCCCVLAVCCTSRWAFMLNLRLIERVQQLPLRELRRVL